MIMIAPGDNFTYHVTLPRHSEQSKAFRNYSSKPRVISTPAARLDPIICHSPLFHITLATLASLLHFLAVPCAWNPIQSHGSLLPPFRSLPKGQSTKGVQSRLDSNPHPISCPKFSLRTPHMLFLEPWFSSVDPDRQNKHCLGP